MHAAPMRVTGLRTASTGALLRALVVYGSLSVPWFVDAAPHILRVSTSIPVINYLATTVVRHTFFKHFVGGETFADTKVLINSLRERGLGTLLGYSVEVNEAEAARDNGNGKQHLRKIPQYTKNVEEMLYSIQAAGELENSRGLGNPFTRKTWVAIKLSALLPSAGGLVSLSKLLVDRSTVSGVTGVYDIGILDSLEDGQLDRVHVDSLNKLRKQLRDIGDTAIKYQVRVIVDAEHSWYQPAIDALTTELAQYCSPQKRSSPIQPVIYQTFQAYLRATPRRLSEALDHATRNSYSLGIKLVRGAYHPHEIQRHNEKHPNSSLPPPVWSEKHETDACYNDCAQRLLQRIEPSPIYEGSHGLGLLFGTHNAESCRLALQTLVQRGLATVSEDGRTLIPDWVSNQVQFGQLLGMADELTDNLVGQTYCPDAPVVLKFVPYGALQEVMPYLSRRAIENKSVLGNSQASRELGRVWDELKRRLLRKP